MMKAFSEKLPKVVERRFPKREKAVGDHSDRQGQPPGKRPGVITLDPRMTPRDRCETLIHEALHEYCPYLEEWVVLHAADMIEQLLARDGYRRIYLVAPKK